MTDHLASKTQAHVLLHAHGKLSPHFCKLVFRKFAAPFQLLRFGLAKTNWRLCAEISKMSGTCFFAIPERKVVHAKDHVFVLSEPSSGLREPGEAFFPVHAFLIHHLFHLHGGGTLIIHIWVWEMCQDD